MKNAYKILIEKVEGKRPLEKPRWEGNIKMVPKGRAYKDVDWIGLVQYRVGR
jgi:hypothetical protein